MQYKGKELKEISNSNFPENTPYIPVKTYKMVTGGIYVNKAFHESTTLDTQLKDLKDREGNPLNIYEIKIPWWTGDISFEPANSWYPQNTTLGELAPAYYSENLIVENGVLKINFNGKGSINTYIKTASDLNKINVAVENPDYDPSDPENAKEFFYDTEPGANIAAYTALNSWEPYTGVEEDTYGVTPDSVNGKYGKLGDSTYLLQQNEENPDYDPVDVSTGDEYFYNQWVK